MIEVGFGPFQKKMSFGVLYVSPIGHYIWAKLLTCLINLLSIPKNGCKINTFFLMLQTQNDFFVLFFLPYANHGIFYAKCKVMFFFLAWPYAIYKEKTIL